MSLPRLLAIALSLAALLVTPPAVPAMQEEVAVWRPADDYPNRSDRIRRDRIREEQEARQGNFATVKDSYVADPCGFGCDDHLGLQSRAIRGTPLVGVVRQAGSEDGVLTVRLRFYNDGSKPARLVIDPTRDYDAIFVRVGGEKLRILKDGNGEPDAKEPLDIQLAPGEMESWWAHFPAPPADAVAFDLAIPPLDTFIDVPLSND